MEKHTLATVISFITLIALIFILNHVESKETTFMKTYGLHDMSVVEKVNHLEQKSDEPDDFQASITGSFLYLADQHEELFVDLPENLFYLSFAPYIHTTHPCFNHNLVTCSGELKNTSFDVKVIDHITEDIIFDGNLTTSSKGFAGIWLPRNLSARIIVTYDELEASQDISTYQESQTCLTTLELLP